MSFLKTLTIIFIGILIIGGILGIYLGKFQEAKKLKVATQTTKEEVKEEVKKPQEQIGEAVNVEKAAKELFCEWSKDPTHCQQFLETLFHNPLSSDLVISDEKLKEYFGKNLDQLSLGEISRGKFDKYSNSEVVLISLRGGEALHFNSYVIIIKKENGKWKASYQNIGYCEEFFNEPRRLIQNEPPFFIGKSRPIGGTCVPMEWHMRLHRLENGEFKSIWDTIYFVDGELEYGSRKVEKLNTKVNFKDIDNDGDFEIIKQGTHRVCKGGCHECEKIIKEENFYQIFKWKPQKQTFVEASKETFKEIGASAVWKPPSLKEWLEDWHRCKEINCVLGIMKEYGASEDAITFSKFLFGKTLEKGFLGQFQEMGRVDLGRVTFPDRVNTNDVYYLINGFPCLVSTELDLETKEEITKSLKKDPLYLKAKERYPNIEIWQFSPQFIKKETLASEKKRFIFEYRLVNGCRTCNTEYSARINFDFDSNGAFLDVGLIQIDQLSK